MSFLDELKQNKNNEPPEKTPKQLWESCFKYFKHFVSILQKDGDEFASEFNFVFLDLKAEATITGPYEIRRSSINGELKLEVKMMTRIHKKIVINRKDKRSAELLKNKLIKDHIISSVKSDAKQNFFIELSNNIPSIFQLTLENNQDFFVYYRNICTSNKKRLKIPIYDINEAEMDKIARYILGQNPTLYTESISDQEITKIRDKIAIEKALKAQKDAEAEARLQQEKEHLALRKANTLKEKSKRFLFNKGQKAKDALINKIRNIKKNN